MISNAFIVEVENIRSIKNVDYIDAVVLFCEKHKIEVEAIAELIKREPVMKSKIQSEAENLNILKRGAKLPI
jgi:hypothetical protein